MIKDAYAFYNKYKDEYNKLQIQYTSHIDNNTTTHESIMFNKSDFDNIDKWKFSYNKLSELSILMNIDIKIIETLGYTEGADMAIVLNTENYFEEITSNNSPVIQNLKAIIILVITLFNQFRYSKKIHGHIQSNKQDNCILDKFKDKENFINYSDYFINNEHVNHILNRFNTNLNIIIKSRKPKDIVAFQIETFCNILLQIAKIEDIKYEWVNKLAYDVSKYILTNVLESENMMTKSKNLNLKAYVNDNIVINS